MKTLFFILGMLLSIQIYSQQWEHLRGIDNTSSVKVMYADTIDTHIYIAGEIVYVDGKLIKGIARWNGSQWDSLGAGINGLDTNNILPGSIAFSFTRYNNELYVGGSFNSVGNVPASKLAIWNNTNWDSLSVRPFRFNDNSSSIEVLEVINNNLYVGGVFDTIAGIPCNGIAKWNGVSWTCIGLPPNMMYGSYIFAISQYNGDIYIAGNFEDSSAISTDTIIDIIKYNGSSWSSVGGGMHGSISWISSMIVYNGELYVGGYFSKFDGNAGNNIQKWDGNSWSDVDGGTGGTNGQIERLLKYQGKLYVFGNFQTAGSIPANNIAIWDGVQWCGLGSIFDNDINACCLYHDSLFIGGGFSTIDGDSLSYLAKWTGGNYVDTCELLNEIDEINTNQINIYPNPAINLLYIHSDKIKINKIIIQDVLGLELFVIKNNTIEDYIDVSFLRSGIYFLSIETKGGRVVKKFIKE